MYIDKCNALFPFASGRLQLELEFSNKVIAYIFLKKIYVISIKCIPFYIYKRYKTNNLLRLIYKHY